VGRIDFIKAAELLIFGSIMRIQVISDLHQEFGFMDRSFEGADLVVLAGDINLGTNGIDSIKSMITDVPVIYVLGNHEYYKGSYPKTLDAIRNSATETNVHVLEDKAITIDGVTFHGATLWTDFPVQGDSKLNGSICQGKMNDYKMIRKDPSYSKLRSIDTSVIHQQSLKWIRSSLESSMTEKNIVVTHHAPSMKSIPEEFKNDVLCSAYASNLDPLILKYQPRYWIHGHIHQLTKYDVGGTSVLCNPHGYMDQSYNGFDKNLVIEI
jgi:Icc-related predicted phosphoesterase